MKLINYYWQEISSCLSCIWDSLNLRKVLLGNSQKNKTRIKKIKATGVSRYIYRNELDKACFQHDIAHGDSKDLPRTMTPDKLLCDKAFEIASNPKYDGYQHGLASMVCNFFDKNDGNASTHMRTGISKN